MAEPLKNSFGREVPATIAGQIVAVYPDLDRAGFLADALDGYDELELTARAKHIAKAMAEHLPADRDRAMEILVASLGPEIEDSELKGMESFLYLPHVYFVATHGLEHFETAMRAQYELTKRFTAEFSLRAYLEGHPAKTLDRLGDWASDPNVHVRRLVSEGTRPRLPWAPRLRSFQADPGPVLELLELLKDDNEEYVRRSVANNLNDIAKDHPDRVVAVARRWWPRANADGRRMIRHGLRTLVKQGDAGALAVLGYAGDSPARVAEFRCLPAEVAIGGKVRVEVEILNPSQRTAPVLADLRVHFVKANGSTSPKVFKGGELELEPGARRVLRKTLSVKQHTTRKHYPGRHAIEVLINGTAHPGGEFKLLA